MEATASAHCRSSDTSSRISCAVDALRWCNHEYEALEGIEVVESVEASVQLVLYSVVHGGFGYRLSRIVQLLDTRACSLFATLTALSLEEKKMSRGEVLKLSMSWKTRRLRQNGIMDELSLPCFG